MPEPISYINPLPSVKNLSSKVLKKTKSKDKKLKIGFKKTCNCPDNHINCLNAKDWIKHQVAIWEFFYEKRDIRDKEIHPAVFPIALPKKCIQLFTHKGELVLDPFVGVGTTLLASKDLDRNAIGFDLKKEYINFSKKRLEQEKLEGSSKQIMINDDSINIPKYLKKESVA